MPERKRKKNKRIDKERYIMKTETESKKEFFLSVLNEAIE